MEEAIRMLGSENHLIRLAAVRELSRMDGEECMEPLLGMLSDPHARVREAVIHESWRRSDHPCLAPALCECLRDPAPIVRAAAATRLGRLASDEVGAALARALLAPETDSQVRSALVASLATVRGADSLDVLTAIYRSDNYHGDRSCVVTALERTGEGATPVLQGIVTDPEEGRRERRLALEALARCAPGAAIQCAVGLLAGCPEWLHATVRDVLDELCEESVAPLVGVLVDPERREVATRILLEWEEWVCPHIASTMKENRDPELQIALSEALLRFRDPDEAVGEVLAGWCSPRNGTRVRVAALRACAWMAWPPRRAIGLLVSCARDADGEVAAAAKALLPKSATDPHWNSDTGNVTRELCRDRDAFRRTLAARWTGALGAESLPRLVALLTDSDAGVCAEAGLAISALGHDARPAIPDLVRALATDRSRIPAPAHEALIALGSDVVPALDELAREGGEAGLRARDVLMGRRVAASYGALSLDDLLALLAEGDHIDRRRAAHELGERKAAGARSALIDALCDPDPDVRAAATDALAGLGSPEAAEALAGLLGEPWDTEETGAIDALVRMGDSAVDAVVAVLGDRSAHAGVVDVLLNVREHVVPRLVALMGREHPEAVRIGAIRCVLGMGGEDPDAVPALLDCTGPGNPPDVRLWAMHCLENKGYDADAVRSIYTSFLDGEDAQARLAALTWLDAPEQEAGWATLARSGSPYQRARALCRLVRRGSRDGLVALGHEIAVQDGVTDAWDEFEEALVELGERDAFLDAIDRVWSHHPDPGARRDAYSALNALDEDDLPLLRRALGDDDPWVRLDAAEDLARAGYADEAMDCLLAELAARGPTCLAAIDALATVPSEALGRLEAIFAGEDRRRIQCAAAVVTRVFENREYVAIGPYVRRSLESPEPEIRLMALRLHREAL